MITINLQSIHSYTISFIILIFTLNINPRDCISDLNYNYVLKFESNLKFIHL